MYRPKGWKNLYQREDNVVEYDWLLCYRAYEAGADAMLEALILRGGIVRVIKDSTKNDWLVLPDKISTPNKKGWLVFIPEEEE